MAETSTSERIIGMTEAAKHLGVSNSVAALRALRRHGAEILQPTSNAYFVTPAELERVARERAEQGITGRGRPKRAASGPSAAEK